MDPVKLLDEEMAGSLAPGVVGEAKVGNDDGEKLVVQELPREVEPASSLANQVQVDVMGGTVAVRGKAFALEPVGADLDAHGRRCTGRIPSPRCRRLATAACLARPRPSSPGKLGRRESRTRGSSSRTITWGIQGMGRSSRDAALSLMRRMANMIPRRGDRVCQTPLGHDKLRG